MCELIMPLEKDSEIGYKIVHRDPNGHFFSIAMGFEYPVDGDIPVVEKQDPISFIYRQDILDPTSSAYRQQMVGRTSAFIDFIDAVREIREQFLFLFDEEDIGLTDKLNPVVIKVELSGGLMSGWYGGARVIGGYHIKILQDLGNDFVLSPEKDPSMTMAWIAKSEQENAETKES